MRFNEPDTNARKIAVYLLDSAGAAVTGFTPSAGQLKISKSGAAPVNGTGTWAEVSSGVYTYTATQAETVTYGYLLLIVNGFGGSQYVWVEEITGHITEGATDVSARRIPIYLTLTGTPVTGFSLVTLASQSTISVNGAAFAAGTGSFAETGLGAYYYQADTTEVADAGALVIKTIGAGHDNYVYIQTIHSTETEVADADPEPIAAPFTTEGLGTLDHVTDALKRLCEYAKVKAP